MRGAWRVTLPVAFLAACGDSVPPGSITVNGRLVDSFGLPINDAFVFINSKGGATSGGAFSFAGVKAPYDVTLIVPRPTVEVVVYKGLTRADPTLQISVGIEPYARSGQVRGKVSGGLGFPQPAGYVTGVAADQPF